MTTPATASTSVSAVPLPPLPRTAIRDAERAFREGRLALESAARKARLWTALERGTATEAQLRGVLDQVRLDAMRQARSLTARLVRREVTRAAWHDAMRRTLVARHYAAALAVAGHAGLSAADRRAVDALIRQQLGFEALWRTDLGAGDAPLDGRAVARAELYGAAVWTTAEGLRAARARREGFTEERAHRAAGDSCATCLGRTKGEQVGPWAPIGSLVPIGHGECRSRCRCWLEYRKGKGKGSAA